MNVHDATQKRLHIIFSQFDNVYVSFSGGKDSGVLLNLCLEYMKRNHIDRKLPVFHIDYEAQYQMTTDYVAETFSDNFDRIEPYHICLPIAAQCATSMYQSYWTPWDKDHKEIWVRPLPANCINEDNHEFQFFHKNISDYELQEKFSRWIHFKKRAGRTCCLVGIRTQESLNRWRAIHSDRNQNKFDGNSWTLEMAKDVYNAYPIFDWKTEDIWTANAKFDWSYNRLYDLYYQAGVPIDQMRVASPFNDCATESLKLYRAIDPHTWGKMIGRVNGVNFSGIYGGTTAMGWRSIKLPKGQTWKTYMEFLLSTLPKTTADGYKKKLETSLKFWADRGGCLSKSVIRKLRKMGVKVKTKKETNYKTTKVPAKMDYLDDVDIPEFKEIPTYKRMCICIMKNDHLCKYMGFSLTKQETEKRKKAESEFSKINLGENRE